MAETPQTIGHGSTLQLESAVPDTYDTIPGVVSIDLGSNKIDLVDNTDMGTTGNQRTFIDGLENPGDITVKLNVKPGNTDQAKLFAAKGAGAKNWKVIYPGAVRTISFAGILLSIDESIPDDKLPTLTAKIQVSGDKTYA